MFYYSLSIQNHFRWKKTVATRNKSQLFSSFAFREEKTKKETDRRFRLEVG